MDYLGYFILTFLLSTLFAIAGLGSAVGLVPLLDMVGLGFDVARASGLFVNTVTTVRTSFLNAKRRLFTFRFVVPLVLSASVMAFVGAQLSFLVDTVLIKTLFAYILLLIATLILFFKKPSKRADEENLSILFFTGAMGGLVSGFLGIGGGSIISPILLLFGYDARKIAIGISFVIPLSSLVAFLNYAGNIELDYVLLAVVGLAGYFGGSVGNHLLHTKVSEKMIKKILALALYAIAIKMLLG